MSVNGSLSGFWAILTIVAAAGGGLLVLLVAHSSEPKHAEAAHEGDVQDLAVRLERVVTEVEHNQRVLVDVKSEVGELRVEQRQSTQQILDAIEPNRR